MKDPKPNPEVYRCAAKIVLSATRYCDQFHSCLAIRDACKQLNLSSRSRLMHQAQYEAMFGPFDPEAPIELQTHSFYDPWVSGTRVACYKHPFWNRALLRAYTSAELEYNEDLQAMRANALLFMAAIVESGA